MTGITCGPVLRYGDRVLLSDRDIRAELDAGGEERLHRGDRAGPGPLHELHGDHDTIMRASKAAKEYLQWATEKHRVECALEELERVHSGGLAELAEPPLHRLHRRRADHGAADRQPPCRRRIRRGRTCPAFRRSWRR